VTGVDHYRLERDPWLSGVLERPAWRAVDGGAGVPLSELTSPRPQFATAKVPVARTPDVHALESFGFRAVDVALTFAADAIAASPAIASVRFAQLRDREAVEAIAGSAFRFSRFHLDPALPAALAHRVKARWAGNWFAGARGDGMVVAEDAGRVAGFLQLLWAKDGRLVIDLIAVDEASRGCGLATAMIGFAATHATGDARRPAGVVVGTQAANVASVRLYESLGFRLRDAQFVLHHHGGRRA
jgi:ribosomal protein S18 acetylase RimI-like enzyme